MSQIFARGWVVRHRINGRWYFASPQGWRLWSSAVTVFRTREKAEAWKRYCLKAKWNAAEIAFVACFAGSLDAGGATGHEPEVIHVEVPPPVAPPF